MLHAHARAHITILIYSMIEQQVNRPLPIHRSKVELRQYKSLQQKVDPRMLTESIAIQFSSI